MIKQTIFVSLLACSFFTLLGCGEPALPPVPAGLVEVEGHVTDGGAPAKNTLVTFQPVADDLGRARGMTNDVGHYRLLHESDAPGVEPGTYRVTFRKLDRKSMVREIRAGNVPNADLPPRDVTVSPSGGKLDFDLQAAVPN